MIAFHFNTSYTNIRSQKTATYFFVSESMKQERTEQYLFT